MPASRYERGPETCAAYVAMGVPARKANALNIEVGQAQARCRCLTPEEWGAMDRRGVRWLMSGGTSLIFGLCSRPTCPIPFNEEP